MKIVNGIILAMLLIFTNLQADALDDAARAEAASRISPVMSNILVRKVGDPTYNVLISGFEPGDYLVQWTMVAYDEGNTTSYLAGFDCRAATPGRCGNAYGDSARFMDPDGVLQSADQSAWAYDATNGRRVFAKDFVFKTTVTIGTEGANGVAWDSVDNNQIVIRFYQKSKEYQDLGAGSISVLLGTLTDILYEDSARRLESFVPPVVPN